MKHNENWEEHHTESRIVEFLPGLPATPCGADDDSTIARISVEKTGRYETSLRTAATDLKLAVEILQRKTCPVPCVFNPSSSSQFSKTPSTGPTAPNPAFAHALTLLLHLVRCANEIMKSQGKAVDGLIPLGLVETESVEDVR